MNRIGLAAAALVAFALLTSACSSGRNDEGIPPGPTGTPTPTQVPSPSPSPTGTPAPSPTPAPTVAPGRELYGLTTSNRLVIYDAAEPLAPVTDRPITGLQSGEQGLGIDVRPASNTLYLLTNQSRLYRINPRTAAATLASTLSVPLDPAATGVGMDFNPVPDRLRIVTNTGQNLRVNVDTGEVATDLSPNGDIGLTINGVPAGATGAAYTNSLPGAQSTLLYVIDTNVNPPRLLIQDPPNQGVLTVVGTLGPAAADATAVNGFDIDGRNGEALASLQIGGETRLVTVNLETGEASLRANLSAPAPLVGLARSTADVEVLAIRNNDELIRVPLANPGAPEVVGTVGSLNGGERVVGMDARTSANDRNVYLLTSAGRVLRLLNPNSDASAAPVAGAVAVTAADRRVGFDFNAAPNALRIVGEAGENRRIPPALNVVALIDGELGYLTSGSAVSPAKAAFTNPSPGGANTALYVIDPATDRLLRAGSDPADDEPCFGRTTGTGRPGNPNCGALQDVGALGLNVSAVGGYDVADLVRGQAGNRHFAVLEATVNSIPGFRLYNINPQTGQATVIGTGSPTISGPIFGLVALNTAQASNPLRFLVLRRGTGNTAAANRDFIETVEVTTTNPPAPLPSTEQVETADSIPVTGTRVIQGTTGERLADLAKRLTSTGMQLFGIGVSGQLYRLELNMSGNAYVATALTDGEGNFVQVSLRGSTAALAFDPRADQLRILSNGGDNLIADVTAGVLTRLADLRALFGARPQAVATAYSNAFAGSPRTTQYLIDARDSSLAVVGPPLSGIGAGTPNDGIVRRIGPLFEAAPLLPPSAPDAFLFAQDLDIAGGHNGIAIAALRRAGETASTLYRLNLDTGAASPVGVIGGAGSGPIAAIAVRLLDRPPPTP